jgi:hypothetical protein
LPTKTFPKKFLTLKAHDEKNSSFRKGKRKFYKVDKDNGFRIFLAANLDVHV